MYFYDQYLTDEEEAIFERITEKAQDDPCVNCTWGSDCKNCEHYRDETIENNPCSACTGEDCICCSVYLEQRAEQRGW